MALLFDLGRSSKRYTHNMDYTVNSTANFGSFQPIMLQYLQNGDTLRVDDMRQLIRNGVMTSPTFGDIKCVNKFTFVPISDVYPAYEALMSHSPVKGTNNYVPSSVPTVTNAQLFMLLCTYPFGQFNTYKPDSGLANMESQGLSTPATPSASVAAFREALQNVSPTLHSTYSAAYAPANHQYFRHHFFEPGAADFVLTNIPSNFIPTNKYAANHRILTVRLTSSGRRVYKILRGLGYTCEPDDFNPISLLPLLAFYKAYFDNYGSNRYSSWQLTNCYKLISKVFLDNVTSTASQGVLLTDFLVELSDCWYSYPDDYVSANLSTPVANNSESFDVKNNYAVGNLSAPLGVQNQDNLPTLPSSSSISNVALQTLARFTRFFNKNTLIGSRIAEYIRVHFGDTVSNSLFRESYDIATFITDVRLDDTYSSADTVNSSTGDGEHLGARGGIGSGFSQNSFEFRSPTTGYVIGMSAVYPVSHYAQGVDPQLFMTGRYDFPSPEFDALGYELTPQTVIYDNNGLYINDRGPRTNKSFGYMPRYSLYKTKKSIINGDMALRSVRNSYLGFHLERLIVPCDINFNLTFSGTAEDGHPDQRDYKVTPAGLAVPTAGQSWRFPLKYPQLGYFNRIFYNAEETPDYDTSAIATVTADTLPLDDNFSLQMNIHMSVTNCLKPLSRSFDTYDEDIDTDTVSVSN